MSKDNVISLENPAENKDLLSSLLRSGARVDYEGRKLN